MRRTVLMLVALAVASASLAGCAGARYRRAERWERRHDRAADRVENGAGRWDRREDRRDAREDYWDRHHYTGFGDRREDRRDRREDRWD